MKRVSYNKTTGTKRQRINRLRKGRARSGFMKATNYARARKPTKYTIPRQFVSVGTGFPRKLKMIHKYSERIDLTAGISGSSYLWSCNGMYDPNYTGTGHQPYYFDQMAALYDHYCVIGSKITVKFVKQTAAGVPLICSLYIDDNAAAVYNDPVVIAEYTDGVTGIVAEAGGSPGVLTLTTNWSASKFFGKNPLANTELQGTSGANPTEASWFVVSAAPVDHQTLNQVVMVTVLIEYIAVWKEIREVGQS